MTFAFGFFVGSMIAGPVGFMLAAICAVSAEADRAEYSLGHRVRRNYVPTVPKWGPGGPPTPAPPAKND